MFENSRQVAATAVPRKGFVRNRIALAVMCAWPLVGMAQQSQPTAEVAELPPMVVTATRSEESTNDVAGSVTAVTRKQIEQRQARNLADVLADEPDVSVPSDPRRFGGSHVNIRGIEENRVLLLTDGVRAADFRSPGTTNYDANNRDTPFVEFLKQVEIVRGPASSLYGSDAIGGVLGFLTLDPADVLKGRGFAAGASVGFHSVDNSNRETAYVASGLGRFQALLMAGRAKGEETDNQGTNDVQGATRGTPNRLNYEQNNVLAKLAYTPNQSHRFKLTLERKEGDTAIDAQRVGNGTSLSRITTNTGDDSLARDRVVLDYDFMPAASWFDRFSAKLYTQKQKTDNQNFQLRTNTSASCSASSAGATNCSVNQRYINEQTQTGVNLLQEKAFTLAGLPQQATWGADLLRTSAQERKDMTWTNLATNVSSKTLIGDTYPRTDFPRGHTDQIGIFAQNEVLIGKLTLTPGLRYDTFSLEPESDSLYQPFPGHEAVSKKGSHISPKFAALYSMRPDWNLYAQFLEGFRGPNYEESNRFFSNGSQLYAVIGNPNLKPETSQSFEIGSKYAGQVWGSQFSLYENHYNDFIEYTKLPAGSPEGVTGYSTYKYQNLSKVMIRGGDWRGYWQALPALRLSAGLAITRGYDKSSDAPLNSVEPERLTLAAQWSPSERWGTEWRLRAAAEKKHINTSSTNYFSTPGYVVNDLSAWWKIQSHIKVNLSLNNILDKTYYLWSDVRRAGVTAVDPAPEFYTQPGRNMAINVKFDY